MEARPLPTMCVYATDGGAACQVTLHHWRDRKTGPAFPVAVLRCATHGRAFTVYPLGHFPYGRSSLAPVAPDGEVLWTHDDGTGPRLAWEHTVFAPSFALVAAAAAPPPDSPGPPQPVDPWWMTEECEGTQAARVLGLDGEVAVRTAEAIAEQLQIPRLVLLDAEHQYRAARGPVARAQIVVGVLARLPADRCVLDRLLGAGALAGAWRSPERWDLGPLGPRRKLFPGRGARAG